MKMAVIERSAENSVLVGLAGLEKRSGRVDFLDGSVQRKPCAIAQG